MELHQQPALMSDVQSMQDLLLLIKLISFSQYLSDSLFTMILVFELLRDVWESCCKRSQRIMNEKLSN